MSSLFSSLGPAVPATRESRFDSHRKKQIVARNLLVGIVDRRQSVTWSVLQPMVNADPALPAYERYARSNGLATMCSNMGLHNSPGRVLACRENAIILGELLDEADIAYAIEQLGLADEEALVAEVAKLPKINP